MTDEQTIRIESLKIAASVIGMRSPEILRMEMSDEIWNRCCDLSKVVEAYINNEL